MKTESEILEIMQTINDDISSLSEAIKEDSKNLPDEHAVGRISNGINSIKYLQDKLKFYTSILLQYEWKIELKQWNGGIILMV